MLIVTCDEDGSGPALLDIPWQQTEIPYQATILPECFFAVDAQGAARPTVALLGGYDGTAEELCFLDDAAALACGRSLRGRHPRGVTASHRAATSDLRHCRDEHVHASRPARPPGREQEGVARGGRAPGGSCRAR